jgi:hypothetical protein
MKLFIVMVAIRYPTGVIYNHDGKVVASNRREAIRKLIDFEMIRSTMICESSAIEIEGAL